MSDEQAGNASYGQEAGTPSETPQEQQPQYVTRDDLQKFGDEIVERTTRAVQGLTDKQESRVEKRLKEWEARLGYTPSPQTRERAKAELELQELEQTNGGGDVPAPSQAIDPKVRRETNVKTVQLLAKYGADFDDLTGIQTDPSKITPDEYLKQAEAILQKKFQPAAAPSQPDQPPNLAHVPSMGTAGTAIGADRLEKLTQRLFEIQALGAAALTNKELKKERTEIVKEMESLGK